MNMILPMIYHFFLKKRHFQTKAAMKNQQMQICSKIITVTQAKFDGHRLKIRLVIQKMIYRRTRKGNEG